MDLYTEILSAILEKSRDADERSDFKMQTDQLIEMRCFQAMQKIKAIVEDDSLDDAECFCKIEEVVVVFEELGSGGGNRHDFG